MALSRQPDVAIYGGGGTMPKIKKSPKKAGGTKYGGSGAATDSGINTNSVSVNTTRPVFNDFRRRSVLCFKLDKVAAQLTLINAALFRELQDNDLSSLKWYHPRKKNEQESDRVTNIARRFNYEVNWVIRQILQEESSRKRAEVFTYFVRLARRLMELNNFHCSFVVTSALQSNPIVRLEKTQKLVQKRDMQDLAELGRRYSQQNNWHLFRNLQESAGQPCVPHIGFYKTDLIHVYHACSSDADRHAKMRTIEKRVFGLFERSNYGFLEEEPALMNYLLDIRYLDELQRFVDDENIKISKALEPDRDEEIVVKKVRPCVVATTHTEVVGQATKSKATVVGGDNSDDDDDEDDSDAGDDADEPSFSKKSGSVWYTRNAAGDNDDHGRVLSDETITNDDCSCTAGAANSSPSKILRNSRRKQPRSDAEAVSAAAAGADERSYESNLTDQLVSMALTAAAAVAAKEHKQKQIMDEEYGDGESHHHHTSNNNQNNDAEHQSDHHHHYAVNNKSSDYIVTPSGTTKIKKGKKGESFSANDRARASAAQAVSLLDDDNTTMVPDTNARSGMSKLFLLKSASLKGRGASKAKKAAQQAAAEAAAAATSSSTRAAAARKKSKSGAGSDSASLKPVRLSTASDIGVLMHDPSSAEQQNRTASDAHDAINSEPLRPFHPHSGSSAGLETGSASVKDSLNAVACRHHQPAGTARPLTSQHQSPFEWQGILKCKTTVKDGQLNRFSAWKRYWVGLWDANLVFFQPGSTFSTCRERKQFNKTPSKIKNIAGWHVERDGSKTSGGGATGWSGLASTDPLFIKHHNQLQQQASSSSLSGGGSGSVRFAAADSTPTSTSGSLFGGVNNDAVAVPSFAVNNSRYSLSSNTSSNSATAGVSLTPTPMKMIGQSAGGRQTIITGSEQPLQPLMVGRSNQSCYNNQWALFENDGADEFDQQLNTAGGFVRNMGGGGGGLRRKTLPTTATAAPVAAAIGGLSSSDSYEVITMQRRYPATTAASSSSTILPDNKPNNPFLQQQSAASPLSSQQTDLDRQRTSQYDAFQKYFSRMSTTTRTAAAAAAPIVAAEAVATELNYLSDNENDEDDAEADEGGGRGTYSTQSSTTPALAGADVVSSRAVRPHESTVKRLLCGTSTSSTSPVLSGIGATNNSTAATTASAGGGGKKLKPPKVETIKLSSADRRQTLLVKPASSTEMNEWLRHLFVATARPPDLNLIRLD